MTEAPRRQAEEKEEEAQIDAQVNEGGATSPVERATEPARRVLHVPKSDLPASKSKRKRS